MPEEKHVRTEIVVIIDKSGSMMSMQNEVTGGINSALEAAKENPLAHVTLVMFDTNVSFQYVHTPSSNVQLLTPNDYRPNGLTALLDALGMTINMVKQEQKALPKDQRAEKVLVTVITDGEENASQEYDYAKIKKLIEKRQKKGWEFVFMGANIDAIGEAAKIGIRADRAANWVADGRGAAAATAVMYRTVHLVNQDKTMPTRREEMFAEIEADNASRH